MFYRRNVMSKSDDHMKKMEKGDGIGETCFESCGFLTKTSNVQVLYT